MPWREGNSTRTATRSDLIRILIPMQKLPSVEILSGESTLRQSRSSLEPSWHANVELNPYISIESRDVIVFPFHKSELRLSSDLALPEPSKIETSLHPPKRYKPGRIDMPFTREIAWDSQTISSTSGEILIGGPGKVEVESVIEWEGARVHLQYL